MNPIGLTLETNVNSALLVWSTPSRDSSGSMPLGNGEIGLNVWAEERGDICFTLATTDAWDENGRLLKLGRVRISVRPNPFGPGAPFRQELDVATGSIRIHSIIHGQPVTFLIWVDANRPLVQVQAECGAPFEWSVHLDLWRTERRPFTANEWASSWHMGGWRPEDRPAGIACVVTPDTVVDAPGDRLAWCHRNEHSVWPIGMRLQGMGAVMDRFRDPLLHRTFGADIRGAGLVKRDATTLCAAAPATHHHISVCVVTGQFPTQSAWLAQLEQTTTLMSATPLDEARKAHEAWWHAFWERSWVQVGGDEAARNVTQGYVLQRWIAACAGRGRFPIKFNGSLFTSEWREGDTVKSDPDYRRWGGDYWYQNTRLPYLPMLASGDFDMMRPFFQMYLNTLPLARERARIWFGCEGAFMAETMSFWGMYGNGDYGWDRTGLRVGEMRNPYIRWIWSNGLELAHLMFDFYEHTGDEGFLRDCVLPWTEAVLTYFDTRFRRDAQGRLVLSPSQALETYQSGVVNPAPDIAGLQGVVARLLGLPSSVLDDVKRQRWQRLQKAIPPLPVAEREGSPALLPAHVFGACGNIENPELYAVWPFRLYGLGRPGLDVARHTYAERSFRDPQGWSQDPIQAACLGLAQEARDKLVSNVVRKHEGSRFPAFWGPNYDWIPDQDHGSNILSTVQTMLLQSDGQRILIFPAWPAEWDVDFKLHAPCRTTVECRLRGGRIERLTVTPESRLQDVVNCIKGV